MTSPSAPLGTCTENTTLSQTSHETLVCLCAVDSVEFDLGCICVKWRRMSRYKGANPSTELGCEFLNRRCCWQPEQPSLSYLCCYVIYFTNDLITLSAICFVAEAQQRKHKDTRMLSSLFAFYKSKNVFYFLSSLENTHHSHPKNAFTYFIWFIIIERQNAHILEVLSRSSLAIRTERLGFCCSCFLLFSTFKFMTQCQLKILSLWLLIF